MSIEHAPFDEVKKRFDVTYDKAMSTPIAVQRNGVAHVVMVPATEFERLARLDHVAMTPEEQRWPHERAGSGDGRTIWETSGAKCPPLSD
ncbi:hypothetical protein [Sphingobium fuliginis]|uniref:hypothetical protein n=1 Tax=Sphingobium fuliginis (strain ATCC 27551) TaxID=336203 RepID=UPI0011AFC074|nr:hypothetical protein [Sphingobium fuliginis]